MHTWGAEGWQTALVTGGGTGIGRGIALALARRGASVAIVGRRAAPLAAVAAEINALGAQALALPADLAHETDYASLLDHVAAALGPIDILALNAGTLAGGPLATLPATAIRHTIATNLVAPIALIHAALPSLLPPAQPSLHHRRQGGAIILVSSTAGLVPLPAASLYSATKAGLHAFGEALRYELEPQGVRLLLAYPPNTNTAMVQGMAQAAGLPRYPLADPLQVGERIVAALEAGQRQVGPSGGDWVLALLYRLAPRVVQALLAQQRARLARMMQAPNKPSG